MQPNMSSAQVQSTGRGAAYRPGKAGEPHHSERGRAKRAVAVRGCAGRPLPPRPHNHCRCGVSALRARSGPASTVVRAYASMHAAAHTQCGRQARCCGLCSLWPLVCRARSARYGRAAVASAPPGAAPAAGQCSRGCGSSDEQARAAGAGLCGAVRLRPGAGHAMRDQRDCRPVGGARARPRVWCGADVRVPGCAPRASCCGRPQGIVAPWLPEPVLLPCCGLLPGLCLTCARKVVAHLPLE